MKSFNDFVVDKKVIRKNALNIKSMLGRNVKFCAVVKANAYGLGCETVCKAIYGIADFFAVANVSEGLQIRVFDKVTPIIVLGMADIDNIILCVNNNISISISNLQQLEKISDFCQENQLSIKIHLQVNTGLNRFGFSTITHFNNALKIIEKSNYLKMEGVYSHFATKENDVFFMKKQFLRFNQFKKLVKLDNVIFHIANSYATINNEKYHLNMVRNGFLLYGGRDDNGNKFPLKIKSRLINISKIKKGDSIGYDRTFVAQKAMTIGVVPLGYADGYDRRLSNKFYVLIGGEKCPVVGNTCMDCFMVDISHINAKMGDEVVILGKQKSQEITIFDFANTLETSPYEIMLKFNYKRMNYIIV